MGHGWKMKRKREVARKPCKCGQGFIIDYEEEWESDWRGDKIENSTEIECPNKDCKRF